MAKGIIILDEIPDRCEDCPCCHTDDYNYYCQINYKKVDWETKPNWCPIKIDNFSDKKIINEENDENVLIQYYEDSNRIWNYFVEGFKCECGCNVYHLEYHKDTNQLFGVCNSCDRTCYEVCKEYIDEYLSKGIWKNLYSE